MMNSKKFFLLVPFIVFTISACNKEVEYFPEVLSEPKPEIDLSIDSLLEINSDIPGDLYNDLTFINDSTGFAISVNGRIVKTTNAGKDWEQVNSPTILPLKQILFLDEKKGYIIGGDNHCGILLKTLNSGQTWTLQVLNTSETPSAIYFLNDSKGYITGFNLLIKTEDGGQSWFSIKDNTFRIYNDIKFKSTDVGIIIYGAEGAYLKTNDGGNSWDSIKNVTNKNFNKVAFSTYKTFFWSNSGLLCIDSLNRESFKYLPTITASVLILNEYQAICIGQHYKDLGYFPYGDIIVTNDNWAHFKTKTYSPSEACRFNAIARMSPNKIMILGNGFNSTKVVLLNI